MSQAMNADICVIGAGSGGLSVAAGASQMGANVVLIEKGEMGGDCLNFGCVPSKSLLAAGHAAHVMRDPSQFGIAAVTPNVDFTQVRSHVQGVIAAIAPHDSVERFEGLGVRVIRDAARFTGPNEVVAGEHRVRAKRYVVATGSSPMVPPIPGLDKVPYFTNETIFSNGERPAHLLVIGGGPIGMELAQAHRRLGADVTVIEMARLFGKDDPELAQIVINQVAGEGVALEAETKVTGVEAANGGVAVLAERNGQSVRFEGSHLLVAVGRSANVTGLGLEEAGVDHSPRGITVDAGLRTSNRKIFAIGDVAGPYQFTHMAGYHAGIVIRRALFRLPAKVKYQAVPWVTYTDPELAHVGLTEAAARDAHGDTIKVLHWPYEENDRAQAEHRTEGMIKVVTDKRGRILGATIAGAHAGELLLPWCLMVDQRMKIGAMASVIAPYPTLSEVSKRAAGSYYTPSLFSARTRRLVKFLLKFG